MKISTAIILTTRRLLIINYLQKQIFYSPLVIFCTNFHLIKNSFAMILRNV